MDTSQLPEGENRVIVVHTAAGEKEIYINCEPPVGGAQAKRTRQFNPHHAAPDEKPVTRDFPAVKVMPLEIMALLDAVLEELHNTIHDRELAMHDSVDIAQRTMTAVEIKGLETMLGVLTKMFKDWRKHPALMNDEIRQYLNRIHQETTNF